jgi:hypothetical protein
MLIFGNFTGHLLPAQKISDYTGDTPVSKYRYILPVPTSKYENDNEKENVACYCESLVNKLAAHPWMGVSSFHTQPLYAQERKLGTHWVGGWVVPSGDLDVHEL